MDSLHAIGFYASAALSVIGALLVALAPGRDLRGGGLAVLGIGLAGLYLVLSAGLAAAVAIVCYLACAALAAGSRYRAVEPGVSAAWRQLGALGAAGLLALLAYAAFRGDFVTASFFGGVLNSAALGRVLFAHDALATEAIGAVVLVALVGAAAVWRTRERSR